MAWAKEQAAKLTRQEKERTRKVVRNYDPNQACFRQASRVFGRQRVHREGHARARVPKLCRSIAGKTKITYDLWPIASALAAARV